MSFLDLCYREAHAYPGKVPSLAARMGKSPVILNNKLNANCDTNHLTVDDAELLLDFTNANKRAAEFFAGKAGCAVIQLPVGITSDMALLDGYMRVVSELGEFSTEFQKDFEDGVIDPKEFSRLESEAEQVIASLLEMVARISVMVQP
jgi:hypothetical protein